MHRLWATLWASFWWRCWWTLWSLSANHDIGVKEALNWSPGGAALSLLFNGLVWWAVKDSTGSVERHNTKSLEFLTGYLITEKSLAKVDNILCLPLIFTYFAAVRVPEARVDDRHHWCQCAAYRHDPGGGWLLVQFHWILYVFGAFLVLTGIKMWAAAKSPA